MNGKVACLFTFAFLLLKVSEGIPMVGNQGTYQTRTTTVQKTGPYGGRESVETVQRVYSSPTGQVQQTTTYQQSVGNAAVPYPAPQGAYPASQGAYPIPPQAVYPVAPQGVYPVAPQATYPVAPVVY